MIPILAKIDQNPERYAIMFGMFMLGLCGILLLWGCAEPEQVHPEVFHIEHRITQLHGDTWDIYPIEGVTYVWKDSTLSFLCNGRHILTAAEVGDTLHAYWWNGEDFTILWNR